MSGQEPIPLFEQLTEATGDALADLVDSLAAGAAAGSDSALEALLFTIDQHRLADPGIRRIVMEAHTVEDIRQDVLIAVTESLPSWSRSGRFSSWLYIIARNKAVAHVRRRTPTPDGGDGSGDDQRETARISSLIAADLDVDRLLDQLPVLYREAVRLRDVEGQTYADVAAALDLPLNTTRSRICRGRALLARHLAQR